MGAHAAVILVQHAALTLSCPLQALEEQVRALVQQGGGKAAASSASTSVPNVAYLLKRVQRLEEAMNKPKG